MADNTTLDAGSGGDVIATDDISGVKYQIVKLVYGALDSATLVSGSNGLPAAQQGTWTVQPGDTANTTAWLVTQAQPTLYTNFGAATKANIKNAAGTLYAVKFTNANASVRYAQIHNKASAPAGTDVPLLSWPIPAGTTNQPGYLILGYEDLRYALGTGIGFAISTTLSTFTDSATASDHTVEVGYV